MGYRARAMNNMFKQIFGIAAAVLFSAASLVAQSDGSQQNVTGRAGTFAIVGARIVPVTGPVIESGTVVIRDGKIESVGTGTSVPSGAERIDGQGLSVYPGMIDAFTRMGLAEIPQGANATMDMNETGSMNANAKAITGINPHSSHINVTRVNGITTVLSAPGGGTVAGQSAVINLNGSTQADMAVVPQTGLVINFPRIALFSGFTPGVGPNAVDFNTAQKRRDEQVDELRKIFTDSENYARAKDAYAKDNRLPYPKTDIKLEAMVPYIRRELPVFLTVERERDIRAALKFLADTNLRGVIVGGQDAHLVADELKRQNVPVIFTHIYSLPPRPDDPYDYLFAGPSKLQRAGIKFAVSTGDQGAEVRDLPYHAGLAGAYGLPREEALKAVTIYPAEILGIADRAGSLEAGKIANVVVTDGDILDPRTNIKHMFIGGRLIPLTSRHTELFDSFKDRR